MADTAEQAAQLRAWDEVIGGFVAQFRAAAEQHRGAVEQRLLPPEEVAWLEKEANAWQRHQQVIAQRLEQLTADRTTE